MPLTPYPQPGVTPSPLWAPMLNSAIEDRYQDVLARTGTAGYDLHSYALTLGLGSAGWPTGSGSEDFTPALAAMVADYEAERGKRGPLYITPTADGVPWRFNSRVYLNSANPELTYRMEGNGNGSQILLGAGLNGLWFVNVNRTSGGAQVASGIRHPRLVAQGFRTGNEPAASTAAFGTSLACAIHYEWLNVESFYNLHTLQSGDYVDNMHFSEIHLAAGKAGSAMYLQLGNGDGLVLQQIHANEDQDVAILNNCLGATIDHAVGAGSYKFVECRAIKVNTAHFDGKAYADPVTQPAFTIKNSEVSFRDCFSHASANSPSGDTANMAVYYLDDDLGIGVPSHVLFDHCNFGFRADAAAKKRPADLHLASVTAGSTVTFRGCAAQSYSNVGSNQNYRYPHGGPRVTAAVGQAKIDAWGDFTQDAQIAQRGGLLVVEAAGPGVKRLRQPSVTFSSLTATTDYPHDFAGGTQFFYKVEAISPIASVFSVERSLTPTSAQAAALAVTNLGGPTVVRIRRGTASNTYDRYADIPVGADQTLIVDAYSTIAGYPWITSGVPAVGIDTYGAGTSAQYVITKGADESVTSSTALQADDELKFAVGAGESYSFAFYVVYNANSTGDFKCTVTGTGTVTGLFSKDSTATSDAGATAAAPQMAVAALGTTGTAGGAGVDLVALIEGTCEGGASGGVCRLDWAQNTSDAGATIVRRLSTVTVRKAA